MPPFRPTEKHVGSRLQGTSARNNERPGSSRGTGRDLPAANGSGTSKVSQLTVRPLHARLGPAAKPAFPVITAPCVHGRTRLKGDTVDSPPPFVCAPSLRQPAERSQRRKERVAAAQAACEKAKTAASALGAKKASARRQRAAAAAAAPNAAGLPQDGAAPAAAAPPAAQAAPGAKPPVRAKADSDASSSSSPVVDITGVSTGDSSDSDGGIAARLPQFPAQRREEAGEAAQGQRKPAGAQAAAKRAGSGPARAEKMCECPLDVPSKPRSADGTRARQRPRGSLVC